MPPCGASGLAWLGHCCGSIQRNEVARGPRQGAARKQLWQKHTTTGAPCNSRLSELSISTHMLNMLNMNMFILGKTGPQLGQCCSTGLHSWQSTRLFVGEKPMAVPPASCRLHPDGVLNRRETTRPMASSPATGVPYKPLWEMETEKIDIVIVMVVPNKIEIMSNTFVERNLFVPYLAGGLYNCIYIPRPAGLRGLLVSHSHI